MVAMLYLVNVITNESNGGDSDDLNYGAVHFWLLCEVYH